MKIEIKIVLWAIFAWVANLIIINVLSWLRVMPFVILFFVLLQGLVAIVLGLSLAIFGEQITLFYIKTDLDMWKYLGFKEGDAFWITSKPWPSLRAQVWAGRIVGTLMVITGLVFVVVAIYGIYKTWPFI